MTLGILLGILVYHSPILGNLLGLVIDVFRVIPPLILIPFFLVLFNPTDRSQILIAAIYTSYSIFIYTLNGLQNVKRNYLLLADVMGASELRKILTVEMPAVMPELVGAIRVTSPITLGVITVAEYLGAPSGIGRVFKFVMPFQRVDMVIVGIVWVVILSIIADLLIVVAARYLLRWSYREHQNLLISIDRID
jgi:ABC-type nitrate/sulfonate/bicarbonate transport system permease component